MYAYLIGTMYISETTNRFVNITVSQNSSTIDIMCTFIDWQNGSNSTCTVNAYSVNINNGCDDIWHSTQNKLYTKRSSSDSNTVTISIISSDFQWTPSSIVSQQYCFSVIANNGNFTAEVIGNFNAIGDHEP